MNILFFTRLFYPHIGGVEKHVFEISKILIQKGHKVIVVAEKHDGELKNFEIINKIEIYRISISGLGWFKKFEIWNWLLKHQNLIKQADIIHCHDVFFWYLPFRFLYPKKPVYTTFHGYEGNNIPSKRAVFMHKLAERLSFGNICVGDYLKKWYGTKPDYVTYGAVKIPPINTNTTNKYQSINKKFKIVFVGRLEEETGIMEYLKATKILKDKGHKIEFDVLGDGALRKKADAFCFRNDLNVKFHSFVENVDRFLAQSSFVFTSRYLGILEALASKRLAFAMYNNLIKRDCFKMSPFLGYINLSKNELELVYQFEYLLSNRDIISDKVTNGYKWVIRQTWSNMTSLYLRLWCIL